MHSKGGVGRTGEKGQDSVRAGWNTPSRLLDDADPGLAGGL